MATVFELSEPYRNHLVPVLQRGAGVCSTCWTAVEPDYADCYQCHNSGGAHGRGCADIVVPIALAVKREQLAHELWHYKYDADPRVRARLTVQLAAVLWRFLGDHETCVAGACDISKFDIVTTVPGTRSHGGEHPLARMVGTIVGQTKDRFERVLAQGACAGAGGREVRADRFRATRRLEERPAVLLIDDTWTTGGRALSAALALREAGAAKIAVVVIGRHFDRTFGPGEAYYKTAKPRRFQWDTCCLDVPMGGATPPELSAGRR